MSVRHAMLALLSEGPKYGLQLREEFEARTGEVWPLNVGQVYTTLRRLERDGLIALAGRAGRADGADGAGGADGTDETNRIDGTDRDDNEYEDEGEGEGPQKAYRITDEGNAELARWLRTPPDLTTPPRDELVMKILVSLRVPDTDTRDIIQAHRRYLVELMQQWTRVKEDSAEDDLSIHLAVDAELFRLDAVVRWLDGAEARVRRAINEHTDIAREPTVAVVREAAPRRVRQEE
ncbi:MAG TPA: PadR family transcriptional regulator [Trebonia sp.]|jgi:DNA-binding PadR family transcriptional regulator|nr:PadR family transcriptional regulator [Trebonia sp.]